MTGQDKACRYAAPAACGPPAAWVAEEIATVPSGAVFPDRVYADPVIVPFDRSLWPPLA